jgi:hypothetical protein
VCAVVISIGSTRIRANSASAATTIAANVLIGRTAVSCVILRFILEDSIHRRGFQPPRKSCAMAAQLVL